MRLSSSIWKLSSLRMRAQRKRYRAESREVEILEDRLVLSALSSFVNLSAVPIAAPDSGDGGSAVTQLVVPQENPDLVFLARTVDESALPGLDKVAGDLLTLYSRTLQGSSAFTTDHTINGTPYDDFFVTSLGLPHVQAFVEDVATALPQLEAIGLQVSAVTDTESWQVVAGFLPVEAVEAASAVDGIIHIEPTQKPELNGGGGGGGSALGTPVIVNMDGVTNGPGATSSGSGVNEWDELSGAAQLRRVLTSITGAGIDIGVISDSINQVGGGVATSQASGDLPSSFVSVLADFAGGSDEGRAMAELVYDLGTDFDIYFHTGFVSPADMASGIQELADFSRSDVIVDDISWFSEPYFQDGQIAQAVDSVYLNEGVLYFSSAGNRNNEAYYDIWEDDDNDNYHEYSGGDEAFRATLSNGEQLRLFLQWDEAWGNSTTAYDIEIWNSDLSSKLADSNDGNIGGNPYDAITFTNTTGASADFNVVIRYVTGASPAGQRLHLLAPGNDDDFVDPYAQNDRGVVGHHGAQWGFGIGAVPWSNPTQIEPFSSRGPNTITHTDGGTRYSTPVDRQQPVFTAADGTETTVPGFGSFFGTSAAAPNAAAVAGLMLEAAGGGGSLSWTQTRNIMRDTAVGSGSGGTWDATHGYGRINALGAGMVAKGMQTGSTVIELNQFGDASHSDSLLGNSSVDRLYFALDNSGSTTIDVTEGSALDGTAILWNQETGSFIEIDYDDGPDDDAQISRSLSVWTTYQTEIFSASDIGTATHNYTFNVNGPNPTLELFPAIGFGGKATTTNSLGNQDSDYFPVTAPPEAESVRIDLTGMSTLDGVINIFDSGGNQIGRRDSFFAGTDESLTVDVTGGETYSIRIGSYRYASAGDYTLSVDFDVLPDLFFSAKLNATERELFRSDGTAGGTSVVKNLRGTASAAVRDVTPMGDNVFFTALLNNGQRELHISDGTSGYTDVLKNLSGAVSSSPEDLTVVGNTLFFSAKTVDGDRELFSSDGTTAGTTIVKNLPGNATPKELTAVGNTLYFTAVNAGGQRELHKSDGTAAGTLLVKNLSGSTSSVPQQLTAVGSTLYFTAKMANGQRELFKSDGTTAGTSLVSNLAGSVSSVPLELTALGNKLLFTAKTSDGQRELHKSSGTAATTMMVVDLSGSVNSVPRDLTAVGNRVYFSAKLENGQRELHRTNGNAGGTVLVKNLSGSTSADPTNITAVGNKVFFAATTNTGQRELFVSNGQVAGTKLVRNLAGSLSAAPTELADVGGILYFSAFTGPGQRELHRSNGNAGGTFRVKNLAGGNSGAPTEISETEDQAGPPPLIAASGKLADAAAVGLSSLDIDLVFVAPDRKHELFSGL